MGERGEAYTVFSGETCGRPRRRREDNIKMDYQEVVSGVMDWIELAQDRCR
jgi:hypothetical protein